MSPTIVLLPAISASSIGALLYYIQTFTDKHEGLFLLM